MRGRAVTRCRSDLEARSSIEDSFSSSMVHARAVWNSLSEAKSGAVEKVAGDGTNHTIVRRQTKKQRAFNMYARP